MKPSRKIKILLLIEVMVNDNWVTDTQDGHPVAVDAGGGTISLDPDVITTKIAESMLDRWPNQRSWWPWCIKSVKQAVAP